MSLVLKYNAGGKPPVLIYRGNEQIDLDAFANAATRKLRLASLRLNEEQRRAVLSDFSALLQGIYDGKVRYKVGGGWNNDIGLSNTPAPKGSNSLGIAAGILGDALRELTAYKAPTEESENTGSKYNGFGDAGLYITRNLIGPSGKVQYFIDQDELVDGKRDTKERTKLLKAELDLLDTDDNVWKDLGATAEQIADWRKHYAKYKYIFDDNKITPNEYLALSKLFGISSSNFDLEGIFYTGDQYKPSKPGLRAQEGTKDEKIDVDSPNYVTKDNWYLSNHPRSTSPTASISLAHTGVYAQSVRKTLDLILGTLSDLQLYNIIDIGLSDGVDGKKLNYANQISSVFLKNYGGYSVFENSYIISRTLEQLRANNKLILFDNDANSFYVPINKPSMDLKNIGVVYKINSSGNNSIDIMDRNDIPYFTKQWDLDYYTVYKPSMKSGGTIRKFQAGGQWYSGLTDYDVNKYTYGYNMDLLVDGDMSDEAFDPWASETVGQQIGRYAPTDGHGDYGLNKAHYNYTKGVEGQAYYKKFGEDLLNADGTPTELGIAWMKAVDKLLPEDSPARFYDKEGNLRSKWTPEGKDAHGREQKVYKSLAEYINAIRNDLILGARHNVFLNEGKRYFYVDDLGQKHWVDPEQIGNYIVSTDPITQGWNDDKTIYWRDYQLTGLKKAEEDKTAGEGEHSEAWKRIFGKGPDDVEEASLPPISPAKAPNPWLSELYPTSLSLGRLFDSLHTNKKIFDASVRHLHGPYKNGYDLYSAVTGAESQKQGYYLRGAEAQSLSALAFTNDPNLIASRQFEGMRVNNTQRAEGDRIDNEEIRRTREEALKRQEGNAERWNEVANYNRAVRNKNLREYDRYEAARLNADYMSRAKFSEGLETRARELLSERRNRINEFYDKYDASEALAWYDRVMAPAKRDLAAWDKANPDGDLAAYMQSSGYNDFERQVRKMRDAKLYAGFSNRYQLGYRNPFNDASYNVFSWPRFNA